jgi:hypothetical protein
MAGVLRKRMISRNFSHPADGQKAGFNVRGYERDMPADFRRLYRKVKGSSTGRKALARYKKFWGIMPTGITEVEVPWGEGETVLVGMGKAGKGKIRLPSGRTVGAKGSKTVACDASGRRIVLLSGRNKKGGKARLHEVGVAEETHYVPTPAMENAKTFKKGAYWVHRHDDDGGRFPKVFKDQAGNYVYGKGTYTVTDWIRR